MEHQVNIYYLYCPREGCPKENYRSYQKKLEDKLLNHGLRTMFSINGSGKMIEKGRYGKPYLKGMEQCHYNISNTDGMVVCAVSDICVGVDVERRKPFRKGILRKCASNLETEYILETEEKKQQEERFFQLWTLKESYIKMTGEGMRIPLQEVAFEQLKEKETTIKCNKRGSFYQKSQGEYWISLCTGQEASVHWIPVTINEI